MIDLRVSKLTGDAIALLTVGSVFGERFPFDLVAEVTEMDLDRALAAVDQLRAARLVTAQAGDSYRFEHDLVRRAIYDSLASGRRLRIHREAARRLASQTIERSKLPVGEIAYHFAQAAALGPEDTEAAASWARIAGDGDYSQLAFESAARHYESALRFVEMLPGADPSLVSELNILLGQSLNGTGETERGKETLRRAFDFSCLAARVDLKARAALLYGGSLPLATNVDDEHPSRMLRQTLNELNEDEISTRARCLSRLALWQYRTRSRSERQSLCDEALLLARAVPNQRVLAAVLYDRSWALFGPDDSDDQLAAGAEMVAIGETLNDAELVLHGQQCRLHALLELGPADEARATGDEVASLANRLRHPAHLWSSTVHKALRGDDEGRFLEAEELADAALRIHRPSDAVQAIVAFGTQRFQRHWLQGRLGEDREAISNMMTSSPGRLSMTAAMLWTEIETGRIDHARALLDQIVDAGWPSIPKDLEWWPIMVSTAIALRVVDDQRLAKALYEQILPYRAHNCVSAGVAFFGNAEHFLGLLADASGAVESAQRHLQAGINRYDEWNAVPFAALCRGDLGLLMLRGDGESQAEGHRLLGQSLLVANRLGMASLATRIRLIEGVAGVAG